MRCWPQGCVRPGAIIDIRGAEIWAAGRLLQRFHLPKVEVDVVVVGDVPRTAFRYDSVNDKKFSLTEECFRRYAELP